MTAAPWELQAPENTGLVPRETLHGDHDNGWQEEGQGRQVLTPEAAQSVQLPIDSRRLPIPCFDDRFMEMLKWS